VHQTEIHAKLISIMGDRLSVHIETLKVCCVCVRDSSMIFLIIMMLGD